MSKEKLVDPNLVLLEYKVQNTQLLRKEKHFRDSINLALNHIHTGNFTLATVELNKALLKEVEQ